MPEYQVDGIASAVYLDVCVWLSVHGCNSITAHSQLTHTHATCQIGVKVD